MSGPVEIAQKAWGDELPDWVLALAEACARTSQNRVAEDLGRSASLVSNVLRRKYPGNMAAIEERVRGAFMSVVISCPVLGELPTDRCQMWRQRAHRLQTHNTHRVRMYRACRRCPRYLEEEQL
ncbi:hypothetical protein [Pseudosulfitobacter pseudonitzschiae]|uniref:hypothetical protein n=1 Tax=Pseudosulfitobacter pseudonitzschiae TaxID=1402135 RepID=UPI001AF4687B|nr:hypothetical protein [Pseudosulfitobacter pseudonitzschiae]MBM1833729.1 hypothetical protein [Pseudosulfitobacter pseudonitzschiae]MBM1838595.1 hypothetical protein [Pseudosulfitobacter pseudonitzschiae]MBM1842943.1 hypothetical protein [Pseudosulfitobacter pseudonitzschiae]MBM1847809.1 hypothetical protein [Pseudosulfitobacter pseudonitzschiae]MBM1853151.1 hypothetical protein [Pseudosulfitobacter pseudonitzschiae]